VDAFLEAVGTLAFPVDDAPVVLRVLVGLIAAAVLGAGARLQRDGVRLATLVAGTLVAAAVLDATDAPERYRTAWAYAGIASIGMAAALWLERIGHRLALFVVGVVSGRWSASRCARPSASRRRRGGRASRR
jgi:hypothetical protein